MSGAGGQALATDAGAVDGPGGSGGCNASSCGAREACSAASGRCEPLASDCPAIAAVPPPDGDLSFVRVRFDASGSAEVLIQNAGTGLLNLAAERTSLCNGSGNCVILVEGVSLTLLPGSTFSKTLPRTLPSGGELAIVTNDPLGEFTFAFVAWGTGAGANSFDAGGAAAGYWTLGARFAIDAADTGFVCTGNTSNAASYVSCNP